MPRLNEKVYLNLKDNKLSDFTISINDCIALCNVIDEFDIFMENLKDFSKGNFGYRKLKNLYNFAKDEEYLALRNVKSFYKNNKVVLDTIHQYTYLSNFLLIYFDPKKGEFNREIIQMYEYIKNNKDDKDKILAVLDKLSSLNFEYIVFAENETFDEVYEYAKYDPSYYYFVDGKVEVIPSLEGFKYKTTGANYEIEFATIPFHRAKITLNNLVFDSNLLPASLKDDDTMKKIVDLKDEKEESYKVLSDSVKIDYNLDKMNLAIEKIDEIILNIHNSVYLKDAKIKIGKAKEVISDLKWFLENYEVDLVEQGLIEKEILEVEKKVYNKRNS